MVHPSSDELSEKLTFLTSVGLDREEAVVDGRVCFACLRKKVTMVQQIL